MDIVVKLNEQTVGRDKLMRLLQYGSRTYWYYAQNKHSTRQSADILRSLEYTFSSFRKLLRLGRFLDSFYSAIRMIKYPDIAVRVTLTLAKITNALFLLADHILWIGRVGILRVNAEKWNKIANKYWLMTIVMYLTRDVYEILRIFEIHNKNFSRQRKAHVTVKAREALACLGDHKEVTIDAVKNGCDLFIPLTALGITRFHPGATGILGLISSAIGIYTLIYPLYKLSPS